METTPQRDGLGYGAMMKPRDAWEWLRQRSFPGGILEPKKGKQWKTYIRQRLHCSLSWQWLFLGNPVNCFVQ